MKVWGLILCFLVLTVSLLPAVTYAGDIEVTLQDGKVAILSEDGTWEYKTGEQAATGQFEITDFGVTMLPKDAMNGRYSDKVKLMIFVKNNSDKSLSAWRAQVLITNVFGEELWKGQLTDGSANLGPGKSGSAAFGFEDNPFIAGEPYDKLSTYTRQNMELKVLSTKPVFN